MAQPPPDHVGQLPIRDWGFVNCPAIPFWANPLGDPDLERVLAFIDGLKNRAAEGMPAYCGLNTKYTIGGQTLPAYTFLYGTPLPPPCGGDGEAPEAGTSPTELDLGDPTQFELPWTTLGNVYGDSQRVLKPFADTLTDNAKASAAFWPTIANFGIGYNLIVLEKVDSADRFDTLAEQFGDALATDEARAAHADGLLYAIDMSILASVGASTAPDGSTRFTPGTITMLTQDPKSKALTPFAVQVILKDGTTHAYSSSDNAWIWALQAAKTSITVWGIWLGHVYHWHIVTAAMQMTMYNHLPDTHQLWSLLRPQSQSLIDFDFVLISFLWGQISPPTPLGGSTELLKLLDQFAVIEPGKRRAFFDDDPTAELTRRGITKDDFTAKTAWDAYPVVGYLLDIFKITQTFVKTVVDVMYTSDTQVANDTGLTAWLDASRDPLQGNVYGLPYVKTRPVLASLLTSLLYRVNAHGAGSLNPSVDPVLTFIANYPPCLQSAEIPKPTDSLSTKELLKRLPHTGTMGWMTTFYYTFAYSKPDAELIPGGGVNLDPWFPPAQQACNDALATFRTQIKGFVDGYVADWNEQLGGTSGSPPSYAANQYGQWPRSIEI